MGIDKNKKYLDAFKKRLNNKKTSYNKSQIFKTSFEDFRGKKESLDIILFSWTVIGDFNKNEQRKVLKKTKDLLVTGGICLIDNPSIKQKYNIYKNYKPNPFYYKDWKGYFSKLRFKHNAKLYRTKTGRERELIILTKK